MRLFGEVLVTMLVILDPPGNVPIFLAVTQRLSDKERHRAAFLAVGTAFFVISLFAVGGRTVLDYLHVSVPALQGAGGLLLLLVALQLLYGSGFGMAFDFDDIGFVDIAVGIGETALWDKGYGHYLAYTVGRYPSR